MLISADGKIFLAKGNPSVGGVYDGCWLIPGGGVDEGETNEQATVREVREETGIDVSPYKIELINDSRTGASEKTLKMTKERVLVSMNFIEYKIFLSDKKAADISVKLSIEHSEYKWFDPSELKGLKLSPPSQELFVQMGFLK